MSHKCNFVFLIRESEEDKVSEAMMKDKGEETYNIKKPFSYCCVSSPVHDDPFFKASTCDTSPQSSRKKD